MENRTEIQRLEKDGLISKNLADVADFMMRFREYSSCAIEMRFKGGYFSGIQEAQSKRAHRALYEMVSNFRRTIEIGRFPEHYQPFLELVEEELERTTARLKAAA